MMTRVNSPGESVRRFIVEQVEKYPGSIAKVTAEHFNITRQAVNKHLQKLTAEGCLTETGHTRNRSYKLAALSTWQHTYQIVPGLAEDVVWTNDVSQALGQLPDNVKNIWHHGFTEMCNNAIDHSEGKSIMVTVTKTATSANMMVSDDGVGIFRKIGSSRDRVGNFCSFFDQIRGSIHVRIFKRRYSSSRSPYARRWMTRILLFKPSTKPSATLFSGLQYAAMPSQC